MGTPIPQRDVQFAQLAVQLRWVTPEQVRGSLELFRRYQAAGGDVPSIARILVGRGHLARERAAQLLRHLVQGTPLPAAGPEEIQPLAPEEAAAELAKGSGGAPPPGKAAAHEEKKSISGVQEVAQPFDEGDDREALLKGLGATVLRGEIKGYKILEVIGEGSMGVVYRAHQISMDRIVALKVLPPEKTKDQPFVEQFLMEARNAGRLNHPNLIRVHEVGRQGDLFFYSMEYIEGLSLAELMDEFEGGRLDPKRTVNIFTQVAAALDHGHRTGIIHREIRPDSIMVTEGDQAKLDGLGLTKDETQRFLEGENAYYVSPEQAKGQDADTRSDIYSLGCCLFHVLTGEPPFQGGGPKEVLGRRLLADPPDPSELNPDVPRDLADACLKMMTRDRNERYQTPSEVMEALKLITFGAPTGAQRPTTRGGARVGARPSAPRRGRSRGGRAGARGGRSGAGRRRRFRR